MDNVFNHQTRLSIFYKAKPKPQTKGTTVNVKFIERNYRDQKITIALSSDEKMAIKREAAERHITASSVIREKLFPKD